MTEAASGSARRSYGFRVQPSPISKAAVEPAGGAKTESRAELEARFLSALPVIEQTIRFVAGRNRLSATEREDFASEVKLAFIQDDYKVLAAFQSRSSLKTYLVVVIQRLFLDYRRKLWGKWRPSAEAMRMGSLAQRLELLIHRDGYTPAEACELLRTNAGAHENAASLLDLVSRLPARQRWRTQASLSSEGADMEAVTANDSSKPDVLLQDLETVKRCQDAIERSLAGLSAEDRVILRLRFEDEVSVADIARSLQQDQKRLYRRIESLLNDLRRSLESAQLNWDDLGRLISVGRCHLSLPIEKSTLTAEIAAPGPSSVKAAF